ncbi:tetratricopeptide repeat protein [uncultured Dokdonia sp.]|uniref:tetratricopeptide repeat protein n=1 Tax=uncultured Dokdonia sp. TaxID=575653 RepID=UPI00260F8AE5|nr:tetratricopeptide repeat protein [uncultured Dokdonia sp.]
MKTKFLFVIALAFGVSAFAQKKEVKAIQKALKGGSYGEAKNLVGAAEALIGSMDDKTKQNFLLAKAQAYLGVDNTDAGDLKVAIESFNELKGTKYNQEAEAGISNVIVAMINSAIGDQNSQNYTTASSKLAEAYNYSKKDTIYLYYAASNSVNGKDYDTAIKYYNELTKLKFSGIESLYYATNATTNIEEKFPSKQDRDVAILTKSHIKPVEKKSESKRGEIAKNIALIYISQGKNEKALEAMAAARAENPDDLLLIRSEANIYLEMGQLDKYKSTMQDVIAKDPNNPELYYNLGVGEDKQGNRDAAIEYYEKAISLNPKYAAAYNNIGALILGGEKAIVDEMNNLGTSNADYKKYDELKEKRQGLYSKAAPYLEKALENRTDSEKGRARSLELSRTLYGIYQQLGDTSKADAMKAKVEALEGGN